VPSYINSQFDEHVQIKHDHRSIVEGHFNRNFYSTSETLLFKCGHCEMQSDNNSQLDEHVPIKHDHIINIGEQDGPSINKKLDIVYALIIAT
jgi:hypothetical protein